MYCVSREHVLYALHECGTWEEGGELRCLVVGWLYTLLACTYTVFVGVSMNTLPLLHWSSLLHVHVHCMLQFPQFVLLPPFRHSPCPFGGFDCGLSEVDLFGAGKGHPVPSELFGSSEGAAQPEGTPNS